jgi:hypothetical protein
MDTMTSPSRFVVRVRTEMSAQQLSVRGLARRMDPINVDRARRNLHRWLDEGIKPGRASRREVATALRIEAAELEDDEESDPVAVLVAAFRQIMRDEIRRAA